MIHCYRLKFNSIQSFTYIDWSILNFISFCSFLLLDETTQIKSDYEEDEDEEDEDEGDDVQEDYDPDTEDHPVKKVKQKKQKTKLLIDYSKHNVSKKYLKLHRDNMKRWQEHTLNLLITKQVHCCCC